MSASGTPVRLLVVPTSTDGGGHKASRSLGPRPRFARAVLSLSLNKTLGKDYCGALFHRCPGRMQIVENLRPSLIIG
jgi:hypothetical protein